jgi:hypothetical protein
VWFFAHPNQSSERPALSVSKFTPENRGSLIERTAAGVSLPDAARATGIREATVKSWLTKGRRESSGEYAEFAAAIDRARESARSRPEPMDADELARVVSEMARKGSVTAAKLRWEMLRSTDEEDASEPVDEFDELRLRRRGSVGGRGLDVRGTGRSLGRRRRTDGGG